MDPTTRDSESDYSFDEDNLLEFVSDNNLSDTESFVYRRCEMIRNWVLNGIRKVFSTTVAFVVMVIFFVSFYGVIIINFIFFISSMLSYAISPFYHGLGNNWIHFGFSILQVIVACPYIQFYIIFIVSSVKQFIDVLPSFGLILQMVWKLSIYSDDNLRTPEYEPWRVNERRYNVRVGNTRCTPDKMILFSLFILALVGLFIWLCVVWSEAFVALGLIPYLLIVCQIFARVQWIWRYWFLVLKKGSVKRGEDSNAVMRILEHIDKQVNKLKKKRDKHCQIDVQTYDSSFVGKYTEQLYVGDISSNSDGMDSSDAANEHPAKKKETKQGEKPKPVVPDKTAQKGQERRNDLADAVRKIFLASYYKNIYKLGVSIAEDAVHSLRNRIIVGLFTLLNLAVIGFDVYRAIDAPNIWFVVSICIRFALVPIVSYFHIFTVCFYQIKKMLFNILMLIGAVVTFLIVIAAAAAVIFNMFFMRLERIEYLPMPSGVTNDAKYTNVPMSACGTSFNGISLIDAVSLAFGAYDVDRNSSIFNSQMAHFFGENWADEISYDVKWIHKQVPIIIYDVKKYDTTVIGFRGFSSGAELALQLKLLSINYAFPFLQGIIIYYNYMVDWFLEYWIIRAHNFGLHFFDPNTIIDDFMNPILDIYSEMKLSERKNVLFTGVNVGGVLAKLAGMVTHRPAVGFVSFPAFNDVFTWTFDLEDDMAAFVTNVYNYHGVFCSQEPGIATNIGVPWVPTGGVRMDSVYQSFCTLAEACGVGEKYSEYCRHVIGSDIDDIHKFFQSDIYDPKKFKK